MRNEQRMDDLLIMLTARNKEISRLRVEIDRIILGIHALNVKPDISDEELIRIVNGEEE